MKQHSLARLLAGATLTAGLALGGVGASGMAAAASDPAPIQEVTSSTAPTWKQFESDTVQDEYGVYIVDGDTPVLTKPELFRFFSAFAGTTSGTLKNDHDSEHADLIINTDGSGNVTKWSATQARNLTYCVSDRFAGNKAAVVAGMERGAGMWEAASSGVNFVYDPTQDSTCTTRNNNVVFSVEPTTTRQFLARAFFPDSPKAYRNVLVARGAFTSSVPLGNILGHELGHTLGFRHEHTRPEAGTCFENNNWVALTPYDSDSIMHYPQCNGTANLTFSALDAEGVRAAYGQ
ncbi:peptidase M16 [Micrococcales bacterium 31B]|nr:peptidase M16 [Micrococcales bacterium 31B]